ncbi:MAG TPA: monovalent cation/H(+) antiporter subunit G [Burkholderiales bacterium]
MSGIPGWAAVLAGSFLLLGATLALIGSVGLLRLRSFYDRVHPPTMGTTLGTGSVLIASMILFSVLEERLVLREILIGIAMTVTTPVTFMLLMQAARHRERAEEGKRACSSD